MKIHNLRSIQERSCQNTIVYTLAAILITIPLDFAIGSTSCIVFILAALLNGRTENFNSRWILCLPILLYLLMFASMSWTIDFHATFSGLRKSALFLLIPGAFLLIPPLDRVKVYKIIRWFSFSMVFYAIYFYIQAILKYSVAQNREVFFFHELVSLDLNAIYVATFASMAMFYFITIERKNFLERIALTILISFVFLLSSRSIFFIDLVLIINYYIFFSKTHKGVKAVTVISVVFFFIFSILYIPQLKERFLSESETAFVDNVIIDNFHVEESNTNSVSVEQAWKNNEFHQNNFFPGTALRIFQVRIFKEMLHEHNIFFTGFGHEASQKKIATKIEQHKVSLGYKIFNFHNQYIQTFAELGFVGFVILVAMLFFNFKNAIKNKDFLHLVFALTMIILLLTESIFCRQRGIIFFVTFYCIFNSINNSEAGDNTLK